MATHASRYQSLDLPHPLRSAAPFGGLAAGCALFEIDPRLPWLVGAVGAFCFAVAAAARATRARLELAAVRRTADRLIVHEPRTRDASELIRWRTEELTSPSCRASLRREIEHLLADLDPRWLPSASPVQRPAARANADLLRAIADRAGGGAPVSARGVVLAQALLRDAASPLYAEGAEALLRRELRRALGALEP